MLVECIPGVGLAPTWTAYVLFQIIFSRATSAINEPVKIDKQP